MTIERAHRIEPEPSLAGPRIDCPVRPVAPLPGTVALAPHKTVPPLRGEFGAREVHARIGEIVEAARMVEVEMRQHDVAHAAWLQP